MELEQVIRRLEWLDEERRKDKMTIATLEERILSLEGGLPGLQVQIKELNSEITRVATMLGRLDQFDTSLAQLRVEFTRMVEGIERQHADHDREMEKVRRVEIEGLNKAIGEVRQGLLPIPELKKGIQARMEEGFRLGRKIEEVEQRIVETRHSDEEYKRSLRLIDEGRRQDVKRITDLQGEVSALRKRLEEQRGKIDLTADGIRKYETRLTELVNAESERKQLQAAFLEKQAMAIVEREKVWREWQGRFELIEKQALGLDAGLQAIEATHRSVKKSQEALDDVTQRFERRINEITEMQRLSDDRFRQDWTSFKADDQKRWTNYTLAQEEQQREINRQFDKMNERVVFFDDVIQEIQDTLHQVNEETERRIQAFVALAHDWMNSYERAFGRARG